MGDDVLRDLLLACCSTRPEQIPDLTMQAATGLGAEAFVAYLADYSQVQLTPFLGRSTPHRDRVAIDGTFPGRAYALGEPCSAQINGSHHLWLPLTDCSDRRGVLEVVTAEPPSQALRKASAAVAALLAQLLGNRSRYGDTIERLRRELPMQAATEIVWNLLPPLTFATDAVVVTGILEPSYEVGGDAFDYAIHDDQLYLALFDAVGHGMTASTLSTVAMNAFRNARHCGLELADIHRSVDKWLAAEFPALFATGLLAHLDLGTGKLRTISAGHPGGLLLRQGQRIRDLPAPTALPLGLGELAGTPAVIVEEDLQPGDQVLFYTDGVIEARDATGEFFGMDRLTDFVIRTLAGAVPPAEAMRRLIRALLDHQHEQLQDDATAVLLQWTGHR
jgi:serine phosphatase RsbU (regulator of sigma subunit)